MSIKNETIQSFSHFQEYVTKLVSKNKELEKRYREKLSFINGLETLIKNLNLENDELTEKNDDLIEELEKYRNTLAGLREI